MESEESREEEPLIDLRLTAAEIFDLYQSAGEKAFAEKDDPGMAAVTEAEIRAFVSEKILPLLLRR